MGEMRKSLVIWLFVAMLIISISFAKESVSAENASTQISFIYADPGYTDNSLWLISPDWPPYVIGEVGFPLLQKPSSIPIASRWNIAQWGIDPSNPLLPNKSGSRTSWQVRTRDAKVRVSLYGRQRMVDLWHSTEDSYYDQHQTCYDPNTFYPSAELDLFIQPNTPNDPALHYNLNLPQNFLHHNTTPPLSQIDQLHLRAQQRLVNVATSYRCGYDSAVTLLAVVFINTVAEPVQVLYYQLTTFDTRWPNQNIDGWFYNGEIFEGILNYGYDDSITNGYNLRPLVRRSVWRNFNLNIRDRVAHLIETSQNSIDKDLSHWKAYSMYAGSSIFGKGHIESKLKGINLLMIAK
jgi:hypothetical protein